MTKIIGLFLQDADYSISISEYHDGGMQVFFDILKPKDYNPRFEIKCLKKQYDLNENETTLYINSTPKSVLTVRFFEDLIGEIQFSPLLPYQEVQKLGALLTDQKIGFSAPEIKKEFVSNLKKRRADSQIVAYRRGDCRCQTNKS